MCSHFNPQFHAVCRLSSANFKGVVAMGCGCQPTRNNRSGSFKLIKRPFEIVSYLVMDFFSFFSFLIITLTSHRRLFKIQAGHPQRERAPLKTCTMRARSDISVHEECRRPVRCKSLQWQRSKGRVEDTGYSPASSLHVNTQQSRHTARRQAEHHHRATKGRMVHLRHQMNKWFIEREVPPAHCLLHLSCLHLKGKSDCSRTRKSICSMPFFAI